MSAQNILNEEATSPLNPLYPWSEGLPKMHEQLDVASGRRYSRRMMALGRQYQLEWDLSQADADELRRWAQQYAEDFFTFQDLERNRYFSGNFDGELQFSPVGYNKVAVRGTFVEIPGLPMYQYPDDWARDAIFLEERNGFGDDLVRKNGTWTYQAQATAHGGAEMINAGTVNTEYVEILYFGYGFRYYSRKDSNFGKIEISLDDAVVAAALDLYAAAATPAAVVHTQTNVSLGLHRVKARALNTKNGASSDYKVFFDAIEVMR